MYLHTVAWLPNQTWWDSSTRWQDHEAVKINCMSFIMLQQQNIYSPLWKTSCFSFCMDLMFLPVYRNGKKPHGYNQTHGWWSFDIRIIIKKVRLQLSLGVRVWNNSDTTTPYVSTTLDDYLYSWPSKFHNLHKNIRSTLTGNMYVCACMEVGTCGDGGGR